MTLDATLMTPCAPTAMNGSVSESSPDKMSNFGPSAARNCDTRSQLPPASLMPMMFLHSARETPDGFDADFDAATARNAVKHDGQSRRARDGAEMLEQTLLRRLVVIRRDLQRAVRADFLGLAASDKSPRSSSWRRCRRAP